MNDAKKRVEAEIRVWAATHPYGIIMSRARTRTEESK